MALAIPPSSSFVKVSVISPNRVLDVSASDFLTPQINGTTYKDTPCLSFLIEHSVPGKSVTRLLFDLGIRVDWENLPPSVVSAVKSMEIQIDARPDVADHLTSHGIDLASVDSIIFSHWHFDHVGDATRFPLTSKIIVGPEFKKKCLPGYPENPDSFICQEAFDNRTVHEVDFSNSKLKIADLSAIDWFGDRSFYIIDTPGHAVGHISALARTTLGDSTTDAADTFVFLAGDVCHHAGELRPHPGRELPSEIPIHSSLSGDKYKSQQEYTAIHPCHCVDQPYYKPSSGGFNLDADMMMQTAKKVAALDNDPRVFVMLAHDNWLLDVIDFFPKDVNNWRTRGWEEMSRWRFLQDFE